MTYGHRARAHRLVAVFEAESVEALASSLENFATVLLAGGVATGASRGYGSGVIYSYKVGDAQPHGDYFRQIEAQLRGHA